MGGFAISFLQYSLSLGCSVAANALLTATLLLLLGEELSRLPAGATNAQQPAKIVAAVHQLVQLVRSSTSGTTSSAPPPVTVEVNTESNPSDEASLETTALLHSAERHFGLADWIRRQHKGEGGNIIMSPSPRGTLKLLVDARLLLSRGGEGPPPATTPVPSLWSLARVEDRAPSDELQSKANAELRQVLKA